MTGPAEIRVAGHTGMFDADSCTVDGTWLHAEGRWRRQVLSEGAPELHWSEPRTYSWRAAEVVEVRWQQEPTT
ncbi:MAG: hypothetical protein QOI73_872 [Solirubrobacteraceae bacterium]|nr:hypothetical protein [Solirubrobacteraceae bacterium]